MVVSFAVSMISGPLMFITILPGYLQFLGDMMNMGENSSPEEVLKIFGLFKSMAAGVGISVVLQSIVTYIIYPVYGSLVYTDLKIRKGELAEFVPEDQAAAPGAGTTPPPVQGI
jgi:hypothetical protein